MSENLKKTTKGIHFGPLRHFLSSKPVSHLKGYIYDMKGQTVDFQPPFLKKSYCTCTFPEIKDLYILCILILKNKNFLLLLYIIQALNNI